MPEESKSGPASPLPAARSESPRSGEPEECFDMPAAVRALESALPGPFVTTARPALIMLTGLPGTGKSYLARRLASRQPFVVVESDWARKILVPAPTYSGRESQLVHQAIHALLRRLLLRGVPVIYDATNLLEFHREAVYALAERVSARLVVVRTVAPPDVVRQRLEQRATARSPHDLSDATWEVYLKLQRQEQAVGRPYLTVDTSGGLDEAVRKILRLARG